jgi:hypothetical protein
MALQLVLHRPDAVVLADGPIHLALQIANTGAADVAVPDSEGPSQFRYAIYSADGLQLRQTASEAERQSAEVHLGDPDELPLQMFDLPAGLVATYRDDLMSLLTQVLAPGAYQVQASYRTPDGETCTSDRVPLEVTVSQPAAIAQELTAARRIVIAEWHRTADGALHLRKRETGLPPLGRFFDLLDVEPSQPLRQCGLSLPTAPGMPDSWRWLAWIEGGDLLAGVATDRRWRYATKRVPLGLDEPVLLPVGYTVAGAAAVFVVAGAAGGRPCVRLVHVQPADDARHALVDVALDRLPEVVPGATCVWQFERAPELLLNWSLEFGGATTLALARVDAMTGEATAPLKSVFTTLRPVLARAFPAVVGPRDTGVGQILLGPESGDDQCTHLSFELANPAKTASTQVAMVEAFGLDQVRRWVLPSEPVANAAIVAVTESDIWASGSGGWKSIARGDIEASSVRLWAFSSRSQLCTWFDRVVGYQSLQLAAGSGQPL